MESVEQLIPPWPSVFLSQLDVERRIEMYLIIARDLRLIFRDEANFDRSFSRLLEGEDQTTALEVESRFWQSDPQEQHSYDTTSGSQAWLLD